MTGFVLSGAAHLLLVASLALFPWKDAASTVETPEPEPSPLGRVDEGADGDGRKERQLPGVADEE